MEAAVFHAGDDLLNLGLPLVGKRSVLVVIVGDIGGLLLHAEELESGLEFVVNRGRDDGPNHELIALYHRDHHCAGGHLILVADVHFCIAKSSGGCLDTALRSLMCP